LANAHIYGDGARWLVLFVSTLAFADGGVAAALDRLPDRAAAYETICRVSSRPHCAMTDRPESQ
jgi:hypothetical protein